MKVCLCSIPVEGINTELDRGRDEGPLGIVPKVAIVSLIKWMEKFGYTEDQYDFYDIDMLFPKDHEIKSYFESFNPNGGPTVVGLSAVVSTSYQQVKKISKIIRDIYPDAWIVLGGMLATVAETVLWKTDVDICVVGDGEIPFVNFLDYVKEHNLHNDWDYDHIEQIKGLCFLNDKNELIFNGFEASIPPDEIAYPDYDLLRKGLKDKPEMLKNYFRPAMKSGWFRFDPRAYDSHRVPMLGGVFVTKGCVAKCTFCQRGTKGYRTMSLDKLEKHLKYLKEHFDVGYIHVLDENFGSNKTHGHEVAQIMKKLDLLWIATGVRCRNVNREDIKFYQEHNCSSLMFGVESGSQKILDIMEKRFNVDDVFNAVKNGIDFGIYSPLSLMLGMPGETVNTARETGSFIGKVSSLLGVHPQYTDYRLFYALPLPGTPLYEYGIQVGFIDNSVDGVEEYLESVTNASIHKRYYMNLNGSPYSEVIFWDWLVKLESSRVFRKNARQSEISDENIFVGKKLKEIYQKNLEINKEFNPRLKLKYTAIKFTIITQFMDKIIGKAFLDLIPRWILYPAVKYLVYFEFKVQQSIRQNMEHNIFKGKSRSGNVRRIEDDFFDDSKKRSEISLRKIVNQNSDSLDELKTVTEKSRRQLLRGLSG